MKRKNAGFIALLICAALILTAAASSGLTASAADGFTDTFYHIVKYDDTADEVDYSAGWMGGNNGACYESTYSEANAGASLAFEFSGTAVRVFGGRYASGGGNFRVLIDNASPAVLPNAGAGGLSELLYERSGLADSGHVLEIQVQSGKFSADYFEVMENLTAERSVVTLVKESCLTFNSLWGYQGNGTLSGVNDGNIYYSSETGASFTFTFSGVGFALFTEVNTSGQDKIKVEIDGVLYRDNWTQEPLMSSMKGDYAANFRVYGLAQDAHTVKVTKQSDDKARFITLDAIYTIADSQYVIPDAPRLSGYTQRVEYTPAAAPIITDGGWNEVSGNIVSDPGAGESALSFTFSGEAFTLKGSAPSGAELRLYLDNKYHSVVTPAAGSGVLAAISGLTVAGHRIKVVTTDAGVTVTGLTILEDVPYDRIKLEMIMEDGLQFIGVWQTGSAGISNGVTRYASAGGAYFAFTFTGVGFEVTGEKGSGNDTLTVLVDGAVYAAGLANPGGFGFGVIARITGLPDGTHNIQVRKENAGRYVNIDYVTAVSIEQPKAEPAGGYIWQTRANDHHAFFYNENLPGSIYTVADGAYYNGAGIKTVTNGDYFTFSFKGKGFRLYMDKGPSAGTVNVGVDDGGAGSGDADLYAASVSTGAKAYEAAGLDYAEHYVKVMLTSPTGKELVFDRLEILTLPSGAETIIDNNDGPEYYGMGEGTSEYYAPRNGTVYTSSNAGDLFTYTFTGTGVAVYGIRDTNGGHARVFLDGEFMGYYGTYAKTLLRRQLLIQFEGLDNESHTLRVEVAALPVQDNAGYLTLDYLVVYDYTETDTVDIDFAGGAVKYSGFVLENGMLKGGAGAEASFKFYARSAKLVFRTSPAGGIAEIFMNGVFQREADLYSVAEGTLEISFTPPGNRACILRVAVSEESNPSSSGSEAVIEVCRLSRGYEITIAPDKDLISGAIVPDDAGSAGLPPSSGGWLRNSPVMTIVGFSVFAACAGGGVWLALKSRKGIKVKG